MLYWLLKSEPSTFSIDDLAARPRQTEPWNGVRNYQARNSLRQMKMGDQAFFYHSSCPLPGIVGIVTVTKEAYPEADPLWSQVDVTLTKKFPQMITLEKLRNTPALSTMIILRKGNRLSVTPVTEEQWGEILKMNN